MSFKVEISLSLFIQVHMKPNFPSIQYKNNCQKRIQTYMKTLIFDESLMAIENLTIRENVGYGNDMK